VVREYEAAKGRRVGSIALRGQMIDEAVHIRAKRLLADY
jgi:citrate lyase beta subunit